MEVERRDRVSALAAVTPCAPSHTGAQMGILLANAHLPRCLFPLSLHGQLGGTVAGVGVFHSAVALAMLQWVYFSWCNNLHSFSFFLHFHAVCSLAQGSGKSEVAVPAFQAISRLLPLNKKNIVRSHFLTLAYVRSLFWSRSPGRGPPLFNFVSAALAALTTRSPRSYFTRHFISLSRHGSACVGDQPKYIFSAGYRGLASTWFPSHLRRRYTGQHTCAATGHQPFARTT